MASGSQIEEQPVLHREPHLGKSDKQTKGKGKGKKMTHKRKIPYLLDLTISQ